MIVYRNSVVGLAIIHPVKGKETEDLELVNSISQFDIEQSGREDDRT